MDWFRLAIGAAKRISRFWLGTPIAASGIAMRSLLTNGFVAAIGDRFLDDPCLSDARLDQDIE